MEIKMRAQ